MKLNTKLNDRHFCLNLVYANYQYHITSACVYDLGGNGVFWLSAWFKVSIQNQVLT